MCVCTRQTKNSNVHRSQGAPKNSKKHFSHRQSFPPDAQPLQRCAQKSNRKYLLIISLSFLYIQFLCFFFRGPRLPITAAKTINTKANHQMYIKSLSIGNEVKHKTQQYKKQKKIVVYKSIATKFNSEIKWLRGSL